MFRRKSAPVVEASMGGGSGSGRGGLRSRVGRTQSTPTPRRSKVKGVMKFVTADDSLHSTYGGGDTKSDTSPESNGSSNAAVTRRGITFKHIEIREYHRTVGDNPSCSSGPPITISWEYNPDTKIISVDQYEQSRPARRTHFEMVLPRDLRQKMLRKEWDVTQNQIAAAIRNNIKIKNQRRQTINNLGKSTKVEEAMESASRSVLRGLMGNSTDKQVKKLEKQMQEAERAHKQAQLEAEMLGEYDEDDDDKDETFDDEATEASLLEDRFVACGSTQDKKVLPQIIPQRPESPMTPPEEVERQDSTPRQPPRPLQSPVRTTHKPTLVVDYEEQKQQDYNNGTLSQPPRPTMPVLVIEEESSSDDSGEDDPLHHKRHANPQETSVHSEEEMKLELPSVKKPNLVSPPPLPMKMPLTNAAAASSPPSPPQRPTLPGTKKMVHSIIPKATLQYGDEDDDECSV